MIITYRDRETERQVSHEGVISKNSIAALWEIRNVKKKKNLKELTNEWCR